MSRYFTRIPSLWARAKQLTYGRNFSSKFDASDALLSDITHSILLSGVSKNLGVKYLSQPTDAEKQITYKTKGIMHGKARRVMVPFVVSTKSGISRWIIFLADTGAPQSFLSPQACTALGIREDVSVSVKIGGHECPVDFSHPKSIFADINLLGTDFLKRHGVFVGLDYGNGSANFCFGGGLRLKNPM